MNKKGIHKHNLSVIGTKVFIDSNSKIIRKFIKHECCDLETAFEMYSEYLANWSNFKYFLPTKIDIQDNYLVISQDIHGESVLEKNKLDLALIEKILDPIIELCNYAKTNKLFADPHIKNFTIKDEAFKYVDISPPYSKKYNNFVILKAKNALEKNILEKNCEYFRWDWLPYHFAGDLLSINLESIAWFDIIFQKVKFLLPKSIDKNSFYEKAITVRYYEDKRSLIGLNLL